MIKNVSLVLGMRPIMTAIIMMVGPMIESKFVRKQMGRSQCNGRNKFPEEEKRQIET